MGFIKDALGANVDISGLDPRSPDYMNKVKELTTQINSGDIKVEASTPKVAPVVNKGNYKPTTFEVEDDGESIEMDAEEGSSNSSNSIGVKKIKFIDDLGDEIEEELDLSEDTKAVEVAKKLRRYNEVEEELKALREETEGLRKSKSGLDSKIKKFLEMESKSTRERLDHILEKEGGYEALRKKIIDEHEEMSNLSPEERVIRETAREREEAKRKMAELEKKLLDKEKAAEEKSREAERAAKAATVKAVWKKYTVDNPESSADIDDINRVILERAMTMIKGLESEGVVVTETILNREFKKASQGLKSLISKHQSKPTSQVKSASEQLDAAQAAAQGMSNSNSSAGRPNESAIMEKWKGYIREGKPWQILDEVKKNPKLSNVYSKFANRLSSDRSWMSK